MLGGWRSLMVAARDSGAAGADAAGGVECLERAEAIFAGSAAFRGVAGLDCLVGMLPLIARLAAGLQEHWSEPEQQATAQLELAQAVGSLNCSNLRCPNLEGGGVKGRRCSGCMTVRYCSKACALADWRAGHRQACKALAAAARQQQQQPGS